MQTRFIFWTFLVFILLSTNTTATVQQIHAYGQNRLSCSLINKITQDANGFIWIATEDGLNKFDGWSFTSYFYKENDSTSINNNCAQSFLNDSKGRLWIGTKKGLQYYSPYTDSFRRIHFPDDNTPSVLCITELKNGEIWIATAGYGIYSIDSKTMKAIPQTQINDVCSTTFTHYIYEDSFSRLWIALPNARLARLSSDQQNIEIYPVQNVPSDKIYTMLEDNDKQLWVATSTQIYKWNETHRTFIQFKNQDNAPLVIRGLTYTHKGELLVNTFGNGVLQIDPVNKVLRPYASNEIPSYDNIFALMEDRNDNLWIGCYQNGLLKLSNTPTSFKFIELKSLSNENNVISTIYTDREHQVWLGINKEGIIRLNSNGVPTSSYPISESILSLYEDKKGNFYAGSLYHSPIYFDKKNGIKQQIPELKDQIITSFAEGKDNNLYLATLGNGIIRYNQRTQNYHFINDTTRLKTSMRLANNWVKTILCDSEGLIWAGHYMGINCYDPRKNEILKLPCGKTLLPYICNTLLEDNRGHIWIGTDNALYEYNKQTGELKHYGAKDGILSNVICGLGKGSNGTIWCSTFNGICCLDPISQKVTNYFFGNGLVDKEYSCGVFAQDTDGTIYAGGLHGLTIFHPDSINTITSPNAPVLTRLFLNNQEVSAHTRINGKQIANDMLPRTNRLNYTYEYENVALDFSTLLFHAPENICYEYRIPELSNTWITTPLGVNRITCNYLPAGKYTLEVRSYEDGVRSPIRTYSISITPPWYATPEAKISYTILLISLVFVLFRLWNKRQERKKKEEINEEKLRFFINIAHELRSPITLIINPLSTLIKRETDETQKRALLTMQRNAERIMNLINQLLDIRKIDKGQMRMAFQNTDLVSFISAQIQLFDYQAAKRHIRFTFEHTAIEALPIWIDKNNFDKVLMNLFVNAFKYTPDEGEIQVLLTQGENVENNGVLRHYAEIRIIDSGIGIDEKKIGKIFDRFYQVSSKSYGFGIGLNLTKLLVELHHGTIVASNRTNAQGSCFTIQLPLGKEHLTTEDIAEEPSTTLAAPLRLSLQQEELLYTNQAEEFSSPISDGNKKFRILVVDDDEELREYLKQELGNHYKITAACNGTEAYQIALQKKVDLIISDVVMPETDGYKLLKQIKTNANTSHIPVILLTSQTQYDSRIKGWNVGADAFLSKPFYIEELSVLCDNLITGRVKLKGKFGMEQIVESNLKTIEVKANDDSFMERVMLIIEQNLDNPKFSVEDFAKEVGISRVQLHRKLKVLTGISTSEFLRNVRLKQAARLLKEKKITVSQISYIVGFTNPTMFSIAFKKLYGCTPTEYIEREQQDLSNE